MLDAFRRPKQDDSPGSLASELAESRAAQDEAIRQARAVHAETRTNVIDRGVARMEAITQMIAELAAEQTQLDRVINRTSEVERTGLVVQPTEAESVIFEDHRETQP